VKNKKTKPLTTIDPLLKLSIDTTRASLQRWTPNAIEFNIILKTRCAVVEGQASFEWCEADRGKVSNVGAGKVNAMIFKDCFSAKRSRLSIARLAK